jgi:penicillin-binding protein 1B
MGRRGATAIHGMGEASRYYFGKPAARLLVEESALLAAIIQGPNGLSPYRWPDRARERRNLVLDRMLGQGKIDAEQHTRALASGLRLAHATHEPEDTRYFLDLLRQQLPEVYTQEDLEGEGLRIHSTLDMRLQALASKSLREGLESLERKYPELVREDVTKQLQGCIIALRPQTGEVLALAGGRDYRNSQFNRCTQAKRPAGSVFKPIAYLAALEPRGLRAPVMTLADRLDDSPLEVPVAGEEPWRPENYDREYNGEVSLREALERSLNVATARLGLEIGAARIANMGRRLGIESRLPRVPSLPLGVADLTPLEVSRAYATIANGGVRPSIRTYEDVVQVDSDASSLVRREIDFERTVEPGPVFLVTSLLEGVVDRGTGRGVRLAGLRGPIAGKTGTSDDLRDTWFAGFTPELVVVVWVGFDEPESIGLPGSQAALPIWIQFVKGATGGEARGAFLMPPGVTRLDIDPTTGARALTGCPRRQPEYFLEGSEPKKTCPDWGGQNNAPGAADSFGGFLRRLFGGSNE